MIYKYPKKLSIELPAFENFLLSNTIFTRTYYRILKKLSRKKVCIDYIHSYYYIDRDIYIYFHVSFFLVAVFHCHKIHLHFYSQFRWYRTKMNKKET